jgi:hypothetical protein
MKSCGWIIRRAGKDGLMLLLSEYVHPAHAKAITVGSADWMSFKILFPVNEKYPDNVRLVHFEKREEAEAVAFNFTIKDPGLIGFLSVEECWIKRCKRCHDCLCGEGGRKRE